MGVLLPLAGAFLFDVRRLLFSGAGLVGVLGPAIADSIVYASGKPFLPVL